MLIGTPPTFFNSFYLDQFKSTYVLKPNEFETIMHIFETIILKQFLWSYYQNFE